MKWDETIASKCRYGEVAKTIWNDWNILWEDAEDDWQGHASFLAEKDGAYCFYEWWYGSCSGCDTWESAGLKGEDIAAEMRNTAMWFKDKDQLMRWLEMLEGNPISNHTDGGLVGNLDILSGGVLGRINAIRAHFGMPPYQPKNNKKDEPK